MDRAWLFLAGVLSCGLPCIPMVGVAPPWCCRLVALCACTVSGVRADVAPPLSPAPVGFRGEQSSNWRPLRSCEICFDSLPVTSVLTSRNIHTSKCGDNCLWYGRGGKCVYKLTHAYAWTIQMEMQKEAEDKEMSKVMSTSIGTVT